jgi:heat shock protein HslJ
MVVAMPRSLRPDRAFLLAGCLLAACASASTSGGGEARALLEDLVATEWVAESLDGTPVAPEVRSTLKFEAADRVSGDGGCNRMAGPVRVEGTSIRFGPLAMTRRACAEPAMQQEQRYARALERARAVRRDGGALILADEAGAVLARLLPADADPVGRPTP